MGSSQNFQCCVRMGKFLAFLSLLAFLLHAAGVANPYWLEKEFTLPGVPALSIPSVEAESNIGLLWACTDSSLEGYKCESLPDIDTDLVEDWQWAAAAMGIVALVCTLVSLILSSCLACRSGRNMGLRTASILCYFLACVLTVAILLLFSENKEIKVLTKPVVVEMEYNFNWGFYLSAVGACVFFVMALLHSFVACGMKNVSTVV